MPIQSISLQSTYCIRHLAIRVLVLALLGLIGLAWGPTAFAQGPDTVKSHQKISDTGAGFSGYLDDQDVFGFAVADLGDMNGDGVSDLAVGAQYDGDGGYRRGAVWIFFMNPNGTIKSFQKISDTQGGFTGILDNNDLFGSTVAGLGDWDGDSVPDLAVGASLDDDGGTDRGAVWLLFLNSDGTVKGHQKISATQGNFGGTLSQYDAFGEAITIIGDLDNDMVPDLAVGAPFNDGTGTSGEPGAVWVLFMNADGTVKGQQEISNSQGGFTGGLSNGDLFGYDVADLGDMDGDTIPDLVVGAPRDDDAGSDRGAVWVLFLNSNGTVKGQQKISDTQGSFTGVLDNADQLGMSVTNLGDIDGDTISDLAVGAPIDSDGGGIYTGAVWILFMNVNGTVKGHQKISATQGNFNGDLGGGLFAWDTSSIGDLDGDGVPDIIVGERNDDDGGPYRGAVWVIFLKADGTVKSYQKLSDLHGSFFLDDSDEFGRATTRLGDINGDGVPDIAVGAPRDDDGANDAGAIWLLYMNPDGTTKYHQKISMVQGNFTGTLTSAGEFGSDIAVLGDVDGDNVSDLAVGARLDSDGGFQKGAVWVLFMNPNGTVKGYQKISDTQGGFTGTFYTNEEFGEAVIGLGDWDGDHVPDLAVGSPGDSDGGFQRGAVWLLFLNADGTVKSYRKISDTQGNFSGILDNDAIFGHAIAVLGDIDGDNVPDLAVGEPNNDDGGAGGNSRGAVWILFMNADGTVKSHQKISATQGNFSGVLDSLDLFGQSLRSVGDADGNGVPDLVVGSRDDDGGANRGAVWLLYLNADGTVKQHIKISDTEGDFSGILDNDDYFGWSVDALGDLDGDSILDLAVGAHWDDDGGPNRGAVWVLFLNGETLHKVYLPQIVVNWGPDLVVESLSAGGDQVTVTIRNLGPATVLDKFQVDVYINLTSPPAINQIWSDLTTEGLRWAVTKPLQPGEKLTLTIDDPYYLPFQSTFNPLTPGTPIYVQIDSYNQQLTQYGAIMEIREDNNILGPVLAIAH